MNRNEIIDMLEILSGAYHRQVTPAAVEVWCNVLDGDDPDRVADAMSAWIDTQDRWPTPADIRGLMRQAARREEPQRAIPASTGREISGAEGGFAIAYEAYSREVVRQGRKPKSFEAFIGQMPPELRWRRK